eukprot:816793-Ditylum_brightwellii.AAC.1
MSPILHLVVAPDKQKSDLEGIPQIHIDKLRTIMNHIYELNNDKTLHPDDNLINNEIVLTIVGKQAMK